MVLLDRREQESPASDCATGERPPSRGGEEEKEEKEGNFQNLIWGIEELEEEKTEDEEEENYERKTSHVCSV